MSICLSPRGPWLGRIWTWTWLAVPWLGHPLVTVALVENMVPVASVSTACSAATTSSTLFPSPLRGTWTAGRVHCSWQVQNIKSSLLLPWCCPVVRGTAACREPSLRSMVTFLPELYGVDWGSGRLADLWQRRPGRASTNLGKRRTRRRSSYSLWHLVYPRDCHSVPESIIHHLLSKS